MCELGDIARLMRTAIAALPERVHVVRTDTSTNPVCTCDQYPGATDAAGKPAQHERGCAYHYPTPMAMWEAYKEQERDVHQPVRDLMAEVERQIQEAAHG